MEQRTPVHVAAVIARLQAGDPTAARFVGLPTAHFTGVPIGPVDDATRELVAPLVERAGLISAFNDAWLLIGGLILLSLLLPLLQPLRIEISPNMIELLGTGMRDTDFRS